MSLAGVDRNLELHQTTDHLSLGDRDLDRHSSVAQTADRRGAMSKRMEGDRWLMAT